MYVVEMCIRCGVLIAHFVAYSIIIATTTTSNGNNTADILVIV